MTQDAIGLVFTSYSYVAPLNNPHFEFLVVRAPCNISQTLISHHPSLKGQALSELLECFDADHEIIMDIVLEIPERTYAHLDDMMLVLASCAEE